jgi:hypothetical protein
LTRLSSGFHQKFMKLPMATSTFAVFGELERKTLSRFFPFISLR